MKNNQGFTLVEILATIFIMMLLSTVFFQFFIMSQKTTAENKEKLVAVNLAQAVLKEIKVKKSPYSNITGPGVYGSSTCTIDTEAAGPIQDEAEIKPQMVDGKTYYIVIIVSEEHDMGLYPVEVEICSDRGKLKGAVKGLVQL